MSHLSRVPLVIGAGMLLCFATGAQQNSRAAKASIVIQKVPPTGPGHPTLTHPIAGIAKAGNVASCRVVVYAHTDAWYVQPTIAAPFTEIGDDGSWNTTTHPGFHYAAVLVCGEYTPPHKTDALPAKRAPVLAMDTKP